MTRAIWSLIRVHSTLSTTVVSSNGLGESMTILRLGTRTKSGTGLGSGGVGSGSESDTVPRGTIIEL
jgi:hypothetical protein